MPTITIKPISVNQCWKGKRYKTNIYNKYESDLLKLLPKIEIPQQPYLLEVVVGFSSKGSDLDNILKPFFDILQKKYNINDRYIYKIIAEKQNVKKGKEFINFNIKHYDTETKNS